MAPTDRVPDRRYRIAAGVVTVLGLNQGAIPLVARSLFDRTQRFTPALWLPSPWWWLGCVGIVGATVATLVVIDRARPGRHAVESAPATPATIVAPSRTRGRSDDAYDALAGLVFLVGLYNGLAPFIARLVLGDDLLLAFTLRLPAPWWWLTSLLVLAATAALLIGIDQAKQRHAASHPTSDD